MLLEPIACNGCGANLELPEDARFVTCKYCDARLEVRHEGGAAYTRVRKAIDRIEKRTTKMAREVEGLRAVSEVAALENDLERLEREWDRRRETVALRDKAAPSRAHVAILAALAVPFLALSMWSAVSDADTQYVVGPLVLAALLGSSALWMRSKVSVYEGALAAYEGERAALRDRISRARRGKPKKSRRR